MITKLKIMLPYLNDEYVVGESVHLIGQATDEKPERVKQFGKVTEIIDNTVDTETTYVQCYRIKFESGKEILFEGVPVQIEYGSVEEV